SSDHPVCHTVPQYSLHRNRMEACACASITELSKSRPSRTNTRFHESMASLTSFREPQYFSNMICSPDTGSQTWRQHGIPTTLISDRDPKFTSKFWKELMSLLRTKLAMSSTYHPQTDGQTERLNQIVEQLLRTACKDEISKWDLHLPVLEFAYNTTHVATGQTSFFLYYGRNPLMPQKPIASATVQTRSRLHHDHTSALGSDPQAPLRHSASTEAPGRTPPN
ncbi:hypothetical protein CLOM_g10168, partial [Closterium sp. NIES-68]